MIYNEKHERNKNIFPSTVIMFLYFLQAIHRAAMAGCKPNRNTAQGNALGRKGIAILRSERAKGMGRIASELPPAALSERKLLSSLTPRVLPWAIYLLGLRPVIAHKDKRKIILLHR